MNFKSILLLFLVISPVFSTITHAQYYDAIVAADNSGNYTTIGEALSNIPSNYSQRYTIFIKNGIYNEKIKIQNDYVTLIGESREKTIISFEQLKKDWQKSPDYEGPAIVSIHADDVILQNLTLKNTQPLLGKNSYVIYATGTRTILDNCTVNNKGSNSVSLFNTKNGMYYINNCKFEGAVDFVRVCGYGYIENSTFFQHEAIGSLWHAAFNSDDEKLVVKNCYFDGVEHFFLGRHHYDACYYFIDCQFSERMADKPVYRKTYKNPENDRPYFYGDRHYFYNCQMENNSYSWFSDNIEHTNPARLTVNATFNYKWNPKTASEIEVIRYQSNIKSQQI
ncbi:MAG: pectinesterase family protein [Prolixibacteraceae bacterium]|jgi:pectinesterase|nr:pectinesterase family protein [Prolixibacteraceae bacterium]